MRETGAFAERIQCGVYEHYKGKRYFVLGLGREHSSGEVVVIYCRLYGREGLPMSVRRADEFLENVECCGRKVPRFVYVGLQEPSDGDGNTGREA